MSQYDDVQHDQQEDERRPLGPFDTHIGLPLTGSLPAGLPDDLADGLAERALYGPTDTAERPAVRAAVADDSSQRVVSSSAVMALGTIFSRASGFVRSILLAAALGTSLHADIFNVANTIPNALYILLAGGVFNAVLVPQLVRSMREDADGGEAYANRVITVATIFLAVVTVLLVAAAPWVMDHLYLGDQYAESRRSHQRESAIAFARYCLPQVFFYGMFVLLGQILNARRRFGPMMWAPIANNVISVAVLVIYLVQYGPIPYEQRKSGFKAPQELLLGLGSTLGIVVQLLVLLPYLRSAGFRFRPRFDLRGTGLAQTFRLGIWTILFVVVNQAAYVVVVKLLSGGSSFSIYTFAFTVVMVPHAIVTVSLATAVLPAISSRAADGDLDGLALTLAATVRNALVVMIPFAALLPVISTEIAQLLLHGAAVRSVDQMAPVLALFAPGILFFTFHYLMLRGLYALEMNRTVFFNQCWVAGVNVVLALVLSHAMGTKHVAVALVIAYVASYFVGGALSFLTLGRRLRGFDIPRMVRFGVRMTIAVGLATGIAWAVATGLHHLVDRITDAPSWPLALVDAVLIGGVDVVLFLLLARRMHIREVTTVLQTLGGRFGRA